MTDELITDLPDSSETYEDEFDYFEADISDDKVWIDAESKNFRKTATIPLTIDEDLAIWLKEKGRIYHRVLNCLIRSYYIYHTNME